MKKFLPIILIIGALQSYSQTDTDSKKNKNYRSFSLNYQNGYVAPMCDFLSGDNLLGNPLNSFQAYTIKGIWQNPGYSNWQKVFRFPYYGVGLTICDFYNPKEIGYPISLFGIFSIPIKRWEKLELYSEIQYGLTGNWKHYNPETNPKNLVVSGFFTFHASAGINAFYPVTKKIDATTGVAYSHFSNGGLKRPNLKGFNIWYPTLGIKYHLSDRPNTSNIKLPDNLTKYNDLLFMASCSPFQSAKDELDPTYYFMRGLSIIYFTQVSNAIRLGIGSDLNDWNVLNTLSTSKGEPQTGKKWSLGFIFQPEIVIERLSLIFGLGIYATHSEFGNLKQIYQRWGIRYELYKNLSAGLSLRAFEFKTAEYMEFCLGYRYRWIQ